MLSKYKAVFFDVGGTLLNVYPSVGDVYARHARSYGFQGSANELNRQFGIQWKRAGGLESLSGQTGLKMEKQFWYDIVFRVFEPVGGLERFDDYFEHIYNVFKKKEAWRVYEDVLESRILDTLKERGVVLGIISNWDSRLCETLEEIGLAAYFDFILASTVVGAAKPDTKIFAEAIERSGVPAQYACHIGDRPETDILGAQQAGLDAILVDREGRYPVGSCPCIRSFIALRTE